jgi:beta-glucanase (GH16 family)
LAATAVLLSGVVAAGEQASRTAGAAEPVALALTWSDEFNGASGTRPDGSKWGYDLGGGGFGNAEHQFYTDRPENASMDGQGNLVITARRETVPGSSCWYGTCQYSSARLLTAGKFTQAYGRFEARMRLPYGQGIWPAFWMLGDNLGSVGWPASGEIDIMENIGREPNTVHGTLHGPGYSGGASVGGSYNSPTRLSDGFHTYAIEWEPNRITWYFDNIAYSTKTPADIGGNRWVFDHPFFLLLNLAVGGQWPGYPDASTVFPQRYMIDYVRVYSGSTGQPPTRDAFSRIEAESANEQSGTQAEATGDADGGQNVGWIAPGDWLRFSGVEFGTGASGVQLRLASGSTATGTVQVRLGSTTGTVLASVPVSSTGGWQTWVTRTAGLSASGRHDVYLTFTGSGGDFVNLNWLTFTR